MWKVLLIYNKMKTNLPRDSPSALFLISGAVKFCCTISGRGETDEVGGLSMESPCGNFE